jgi:hypothetical protein
MAHCPYDQLKDVEPAFAAIRAWEGIREPKPGIFYLKRDPFLHFHTKDDARWADVKCGKTWGAPIDLPKDASSASLKKFLKDVDLRYRKTRGLP